MEIYIVLFIVALIIFSPKIIWRLYQRYRYSESIKDLVSKPFVCPNCGHRFYTEQRFIQPLSKSKAILKCPNCGKRGACGRPYDFNEHDM